MATIWERAAHSFYRMFSLYFDIVILVFFTFGFEGVRDFESDCVKSRSLLIFYFLQLVPIFCIILGIKCVSTKKSW